MVFGYHRDRRSGTIALRPYDRIFSDGTTEKRYIQEIIFGKRRQIQYWQVTTDPKTLPKNSTWFIMTKVSGIKYKEVGNLSGLRNWVEYGRASE